MVHRPPSPQACTPDRRCCGWLPPQPAATGNGRRSSATPARSASTFRVPRASAHVREIPVGPARAGRRRCPPRSAACSALPPQRRRASASLPPRGPAAVQHTHRFVGSASVMLPGCTVIARENWKGGCQFCALATPRRARTSDQSEAAPAISKPSTQSRPRAARLRVGRRGLAPAPQRARIASGDARDPPPPGCRVALPPPRPPHLRLVGCVATTANRRGWVVRPRLCCSWTLASRRRVGDAAHGVGVGAAATLACGFQRTGAAVAPPALALPCRPAPISHPSGVLAGEAVPGDDLVAGMEPVVVAAAAACRWRTAAAAGGRVERAAAAAGTPSAWRRRSGWRHGRNDWPAAATDERRGLSGVCGLPRRQRQWCVPSRVAGRCLSGRLEHVFWL